MGKQCLVETTSPVLCSTVNFPALREMVNDHAEFKMHIKLVAALLSLELIQNC